MRRIRALLHPVRGRPVQWQLCQPDRYELGELECGGAGIKHWIDTHYDQDVSKDDLRLLTIRDKVDAEYEAGRTTAISDDEMQAWYQEAFE